MSFKRLIVALAATSTLGLAMAAPAQAGAPLTDPAAATHCKAMGQVFRAKSDGLVTKNKTLVATFPNPDEPTKAMIAKTTHLQGQLDSIATALEAGYSDAAAPSATEAAAVGASPLKDLMPQVQTCLGS